jgi:hypothetical protein
VPGRKGKLGTFDGGAYYPDGTVCKRSLHLKNGLLNVPVPLEAQASAPLVPGTHIFAGLLKNEHFGHFMAESLARLWALGYINRDVRSLVYYVRDKGLPVPGFIKQTLDLIRPGLEVHLVSSLEQFETLIVPDQIVHPVIGFIYGHPAVRELFAHLRTPKRGLPRKVYLSRSKLTPNEGNVLGEEILERNLEADGYTIIHPQHLSIKEQLDVYASADSLIFGEGSSLHLYALAAQPDQRVYIVRRRPMSIVFDWQVKTFGGPTIEGSPCISRFIIPENDADSMMRAKAVLDFGALRRQMQGLGFVGGKEWRAPTEGEIRDEISRVEAALRTKLVEHIPT